MDVRDVAIFDSLRIMGSLQFEELLVHTKNKTKISRQTFDIRLKLLVREGWIIHTKKKYGLNFSKKENVNLEKESRKIEKLVRRVEKFPHSNDPFGEGFEIVQHVFAELLIPARWKLKHDSSEMNQSEKRLLETYIRRYEETLDTMMDKLYQLNYQAANLFFQSLDLLFLKKEK